jgi:hypothetical protein
MNRALIAIASLLLAVIFTLPALTAPDDEPPKDVEFTFARIRYHMTIDAAWEQRREVPWHHDFPESDGMFTSFVSGVTNINTRNQAYKIVDIDDEDLFQYPFAYLCEPGYLELNERDVRNLREYLDRGGFLLIDDFRGQRHLSNLVYQMKKVYPNRNITPLTLQHKVFDSFYSIESLDVRPPYGFEPVQFFGMEDDDGRLIMAINYNHDLGEVWQWLNEGRASMQDAAESLKFGTNYLLYAFTH